MEFQLSSRYPFTTATIEFQPTSRYLSPAIIRGRALVRTGDLPGFNRTLYPTELRGQKFTSNLAINPTLDKPGWRDLNPRHAVLEAAALPG